MIILLITVVSSHPVTFDPSSDCPEPPNIIAIIGGSVAAVALIGILLLMVVKLLIYMKDLKEYRKFEKERAKSDWTKVRQTSVTGKKGSVVTQGREGGS